DFHVTGVQTCALPICIEYCRRAALVERRYLNRLDRAATLLERALELAPSDRELKVLLADALLEFGGFERAREILESLLEEFGRQIGRASCRGRVRSSE